MAWSVLIAITAAAIVNAVDGHVEIGNTPAAAHSTVALGQSVRTAINSRAEILLSPGVFVRIGPESSVTLTAHGIQVREGDALIEVLDSGKHEFIEATALDATMTFAAGLYGVHVADASSAMYVISGHADLSKSNSSEEISSHHAVAIAKNLRDEKLDSKAVRSLSLYAWSEERTRLEAAANLDAVRHRGKPVTGWVLDSTFATYTLVPSTPDNSAFGYRFIPEAAGNATKKMPLNGEEIEVAIDPKNPPLGATGPLHGTHSAEKAARMVVSAAEMENETSVALTR